jgi:hypothetical protein
MPNDINLEIRGHENMKKLPILVIIGLIIASGIGAAATPTATHTQARQISKPSGVAFQDELDQSMTTPDGVLPIGAIILNATRQTLSAAQSFVPQKDVFTRALLLMARNATTTRNCTCDLKENLTGDALATVQATPDQFRVYDPTNQTGNLTWVEFDFYSVWVTPGNTYYLVVHTENVTNNTYWCAGNGSNLYPNGSAYFSLDNGQTWQNLTGSDACFQTYGVEETTFSITVSKGLLGPSFTIKNVGNHTAGSVISNITVDGGVLGLIHSSNLNIVSDLLPGTQMVARPGLVLGFGPVKITETVFAINAKEQSVHLNATLILIFIIVK